MFGNINISLVTLTLCTPHLKCDELHKPKIKYLFEEFLNRVNVQEFQYHFYNSQQGYSSYAVCNFKEIDQASAEILAI